MGKWSTARSRESSPLLSRLARSKEVSLANHLDCKMNPLFARSVHPKMSANILDHVTIVRILAVLLEAKFSNSGSRRAATAPTRATGGVFFFFPRSATIAENPKKETKLPGCFSNWSEIQNSKTPSESVFNLSKFLFQANSSARLVSSPAPSGAHLEEDSEPDADAAAAWRRIDNPPLWADYRFSPRQT